MRALARIILTLALAASLVLTLTAAGKLAADPHFAPWRDATLSEITASTEQLLAETATPDAVVARITARLAEDPRDWVVLDALTDLARDRGIELPADLIDRLQIQRDTDSGFLATAEACGACVMDATTCSVNLLLMCRAPIDLTFVGDVAGIVRAGTAHMSGQEVDEIDLGLSIVGLGATALVLFSGGTSLTVKAGAGLAKMARGAGRLSGGLTGLIRVAVRDGVDWAKLPAIRSADDLALAIRADAFQPVFDTAADLTRLQGAAGTARALHLLPLVDGPASARRLANAAEAVGPSRLIAGAELAGPARMLRSTVRFSSAATQFVSGLLAFVTLLASLVVGAVKSIGLRLLRRVAR